MRPAFLYSLVTQHWHQIAGSLLLVLGFTEVFVDDFTTNSRLEYYLIAWAAITGGFWFLFDLGERTIGAEYKAQLADLVRRGNAESLRAIPAQFAAIFDDTFGERHLSLKCFIRSVEASMISVVIIYALATGLGLLSRGDWGSALETVHYEFVALGLGALIVNVLPDYLSLLQSRWLIGRMQDSSMVRILRLLLLDFVLTGLIWILFMLALIATAFVQNEALVGFTSFLLNEHARLAQVTFGFSGDDGSGTGIVSVFFYSTYFTSVWLWLYALSVMLSRVLVHTNHGVGFLLRMTDVEAQPLRSLGFVIVIGLSALFLLGLPFVL